MEPGAFGIKGKRKEYQEEKNERDRTGRRLFIEEMKNLKLKIKIAKLEEIEEAFGNDPWGSAYKFIRKRENKIAKDLETGDENKLNISKKKRKMKE